VQLSVITDELRLLCEILDGRRRPADFFGLLTNANRGAQKSKRDIEIFVDNEITVQAKPA
jgi:hypothetical protein